MNWRTRVEREYAATHARLADDPEYQRLALAADQETKHEPTRYFARNSLAIYVETQMPPIKTARRIREQP